MFFNWFILLYFEIGLVFYFFYVFSGVDFSIEFFLILEKILYLDFFYKGLELEEILVFGGGNDCGF